jgi:hypothetical protein
MPPSDHTSAQAASFAFRRWAQPVLEGLLDSRKAIPFKTAQRFLGWNQITLLRRVINHQGARGVPFISPSPSVHQQPTHILA